MKVYLVYSCYNDYAQIWKDLQKIFLNKENAEEYVELSNYQASESNRENSLNEWFEYQEWEVEE